ncbi:MAG: CDP-alcohol phosphatidyltransferase family protein [Proteobacteria bacterium]|nr:CDP-alcohol phosphatidyltransferase family protein [Pseudomonadota bacterium]MDA1021882.1 CDP-alcohol phosphatidyltransferase family protein [Pseudomonadota bacterium]
MNIANLITLGRLFSVPVVVWLILSDQLMVGFWVFFVAAISDGIDGAVAKYISGETVFGSYLDPLADKALLVSAFLSLGHDGYIATWLVILVVFRDLLIIGGATLFQTVTRSLDMKPLLISKINTFMQLVLVTVVLWAAAYDIQGGIIIAVLGYIVGATTFLSGAAYVITWSNKASEMEGKE